MVGKTFLGKYRVRKFLGQGSNAHVYLATSLANPTERVVVKRIKHEATQAPRFQQFFQAEVKSMNGFRHPYAVRFIDASLTDPLGPCLVMEYIQGVTLEQVIQRDGRLHQDRVGRLLGPLAHALYAAQLKGIAHRDLKPANLMVIDPGTDHESIKVMDFGFAGFTAKPHIQLAELTGQGPIFACGTPAYVSPEMIRGDSTDARADIYSVGVILFELLTGRLPFEHANQEDLLSAHVREQPPRFHRIGCGDVPPRVEGVVQHALSKFPSERPATMKDLLEAYSRAVGWDIWEATAPLEEPGMADDELNDAITLTVAEPITRIDSASDRFILSDQFQACLPERLAAIKLRGFIEEVGGHVVDSEPGLILVRVDLPTGWKEPVAPSTRSGLFTFLAGTRKMAVTKGREPIEVELKMKKLDANMVIVQVIFRPMPDHLPTSERQWAERCEGLYSLLRKFVMPEG